MKRKVGRPRIPKRKAKTVLYGARVSLEEAANITKKLAESGQTATHVIRRAFDHFIPLIWTTPKQSYEDLHGKTVEFRLSTTKDGKPWETSGCGKFFAIRHASSPSTLGLEIWIELQEGRATRLIRIPLNQQAVDLIERHPDPRVAVFSCLDKS